MSIWFLNTMLHFIDAPPRVAPLSPHPSRHSSFMFASHLHWFIGPPTSFLIYYYFLVTRMFFLQTHRMLVIIIVITLAAHFINHHHVCILDDVRSIDHCSSSMVSCTQPHSHAYVHTLHQPLVPCTTVLAYRIQSYRKTPYTNINCL